MELKLRPTSLKFQSQIDLKSSTSLSNRIQGAHSTVVKDPTHSKEPMTQ